MYTRKLSTFFLIACIVFLVLPGAALAGVQAEQPEGGLLVPSPNPSWSKQGDQAFAGFGSSVSDAGDVNGDGFGDVIVGAAGYSNGEAYEGRAYVYYGSAAGLSLNPDWTAESDLSGAGFGWSVSAAGDVNGDGYGDVIIGADGYDNGEAFEGRAYVYHGSATGLSLIPNWTAEGNQEYAVFGDSVSAAGDVNGDGYGDVIIGAWGYSNGEIYEGRAYVYYGSAAGLSLNPDWTAEGGQEGANLGFSVSGASDVNGDGYDDVIVGALGYSNGEAYEGRAYVYYGSSNGLSITPAWIAESDQESAQFGISVSASGDVNGDGYGDVIVGANGYPHTKTSGGGALAFYGSADGLSPTPNWIAVNDQLGANFGYTVSSAGDVNGDGYSDVMVGALYYDNGEIDEGRAYLYFGRANGLRHFPVLTYESNQSSAYLGYSISSAGDVNGDGFGDVVVGTPWFSKSYRGAAFAWYGR